MTVLSYIAKHDVTLEPIYKSIVLAGEDVKFFMYEVRWRLYVVAILVYSNSVAETPLQKWGGRK